MRASRGWAAMSALTFFACAAPPVDEEPPPAPPVRLDQVRTAIRTPHATGTSELRPLRRATLSSEAPGRVISLGMERGQRVEAGEVLLRLDVGRTAVASAAASAGVAQAEAALAQAQRERELAARLLESGSASRRNFEQSQDAERLARTALDSARAQVRVTRRGLTEAVLRAPFAGVIVERGVELGEFLSPGAPVCVLMDASSLRADVLLDPRDALDVEPGARVEAEIFARPGERFSGAVLRVGEAVDRQTRRLPVEVEVLDPDRRLRPGLVARFEVATAPPRDVLTVDVLSAFERFEVMQVYVVGEDSIAERRAVVLGPVEEGRAAVVEGLSAGERVVSEGQDRVLDGEPVRVIEPAPGADRVHAERTDV